MYCYPYFSFLTPAVSVGSTCDFFLERIFLCYLLYSYDLEIVRIVYVYTEMFLKIG